ASRHLILPAFTDLHLHLSQFDIVGAYGRPLLDWLDAVTFPAEAKWADAAFAEAATHRALDRLVAVGTTGVCAYTPVHHEATMRALEAVRQRKLRGRVGQVLMDREAPAALIRPTAQLLDECRATLAWDGAGARVTAAVTPRFAVTCTDALLRGCGEIAAGHDAFIQTHLAETREECAAVARLCGADYVEVYRRAGLLGPKAIHGHGVHLSAADRDRLTQTRTVVAHCPQANTFLRSGTMDRAALHRAGVRVGLGSDIGAGYERSMVRVARAAVEVEAALHPGEPAPDVGAAWRQITAGNA